MTTSSLRYQMHEGYFTLDGSWQDQSVNVFVPQQPDTKGVNLVVARDTMPLGMSFADYMTNQKITFEKDLKDFTLLTDNVTTLDKRPARYLEFTWNNQGNPLRQIIVVAPHEQVAFSMTATLPGEFTEDAREMLLKTMSSFRFGTPDANPGS